MVEGEAISRKLLTCLTFLYFSCLGSVSNSEKVNSRCKYFSLETNIVCLYNSPFEFVIFLQVQQEPESTSGTLEGTWLRSVLFLLYFIDLYMFFFAGASSSDSNAVR